MDRRLLLAVALSAVVLIVFQTMFAPKPSRRESGAAADSLSRPSASVPSTTGTEPGPPAQAPPASGERASAPEEETGATTSPREGWQASSLNRAEEEHELDPVRTDLMEIRFTNRGGQVSSWKLNRFMHENGGGPDERVELVRDGAELATVVETPSGDMDLEETLFSSRRETGPDGSTRIVFEAGGETGLRVTKTYIVPAEGYLVRLEHRIEGAQDATGFRLVWDGGIPPAESREQHYRSSVSTIALLGTDKETIRPGSFKRERSREMQGTVWWAGVRNKYFMATMIPAENASHRIVVTGDNDEMITGVQIGFPVLAGASSQDLGLYLGPLDYDGLKALDHHLQQAVDLGRWKVFRPISSLLLEVMTWMYKFIPNYGVVIILISILAKGLFYPLTKSSIRSMRAMQQIQPEMQRIREKYKKDPKTMQAKTMELYKENKVNPLGGCLPLLVQMPVFFALYSVLSNSIAMRGAHFVWWINDLSVPETIFHLGGSGGFPIHVLPLVMFGTSVLQARLTPPGSQQQKMMSYMMPAVLLFIFYSFPAGLNLYWTVNNALQVAQQWVIHREHPVPAAAPTTAKA